MPARPESRRLVRLTILAAAVTAFSPPPGAADPYQWSLWPMPYPRTEHVAIYDPVRDRMLLHGGLSTGPDGGYSYDLWSLGLEGTPEWQWLGIAGPIGRKGHVAVYDTPGDRMILFGGVTDGVGLNDCWQYDLATGGWSSFGTGTRPPASTMGYVAAFDGLLRRMLIHGGGATLYTLDLATGAWGQTATVNPPGQPMGAMTFDPVRNRLLVFNPGVWELSLSGTPTWTQLSPTGTAPADLVGDALYDAARDRVEFVRADGSVWALSMASPPVWSQLSSSPLPPGSRPAATVVHDSDADRLLLHGGPGSNDTWAFDLVANVWAQVDAGGPIPVLAKHTAVVVPEWDAMVAVQGNTWKFALDESGFTQVTTVGPGPSTRLNAASIHDPVRQRVIVFGGRTIAGTYFNDVHALSTTGTPTWSALAPTGTKPAARWQCDAIYDPAGDRMILFGGRDGSTGYSDVWALSLAGTPSWSQVIASGLLPSLGDAPVVHDSRRGRLIVMGTTFPGGLKAWALPLSGTPAWTPLAGGAGSLDRYSFDAAYDSLNDRALIYGGTNGFNGMHSSLLALDLSPSEGWATITPPEPRPLARVEHTLVRDAPRNRFVLYGGRESINGDYAFGTYGASALWFLTDLGVTAVPPPGPASRLALADCRLAGRNRVAVSFTAPGPGEVSIDVLDLQGRRIGRSVSRVEAAGARREDVHLPAAPASGLYLVLLRQKDQAASGKLVVLR